MRTQIVFGKILAFLFCSLGLIFAFLAQRHLLVPSYVASAVVGFLGSFIPNLSWCDNKQLTAAVYTGSFASMCSLSFFSSILDVILLSVLTGASFLFLSSHFKGYGGKLGSIGFLASLAFIFLKATL